MARKVYNEFLDLIEDKYGDMVVAKDEDIEVISTGSLAMDISLGVGGIPLRRFTEIYGPESSGKSSLALMICKNAIKAGYRVMYIDVEHTMDLHYAKTIMGDFNGDDFVIVQPKTAEDALNLAEVAVQSYHYQLIILDSVGALVTEKELTDELTDKQVAVLASLMTSFIHRMNYEVRTRDIAFVFINQVRATIGGNSFFASYSTPGGYSLKHNCSIRIQLSTGTKLKIGEEVIGMLMTFLIKKNKLAPPFRSFSTPLIFGKGIDSEWDAFDFALKIGVIERQGKSFYRFDDLQLGGVGKNSSIQFLKENQTVLDSIRDRCYNIVNNIYEREVEDVEEDSSS